MACIYPGEFNDDVSNSLGIGFYFNAFDSTGLQVGLFGKE